MTDRDHKKNEILQALRTVRLEGATQDLVDLGWVTDVTFCEGAAKAVLKLPMAGSRVRDAIKASASDAVSKLPWVTNANIQVQFQPIDKGQGSPDTPLAQVRDIIAVGSGKGGVGKSTVAVNLAAAMARSGAKVGLLDADVYGPSIPTMLGQKTARPSPVDGPGGKKLFGPITAHGIKLMSMGFMVDEDRPLIWRGPMLHGALKQFFGDVAWGELDVLIIDLPPGTGDVALTMAQTISLTGAVVVSTPQEVAMVDARRAVAMFEQTGVPLLGLVENMGGEVFGEGHVKAWSEARGHRFLGAVPLASAVRKSGDSGTPAALSDDSSVAGPFLDLADRVLTAMAVRNVEAPPKPTISLQGS